MNQYNSSSSNISALVVWLIHRFLGFFYPVQHIAFAYAENFPDTSSAYAGVIDTYSLLSDGLWIFPCLSIERIFVFAILAYTSLCSRSVIPCVNLVPYLRAFGTAPLFVYRLFSHALILPHLLPFVKTPLGHSSKSKNLALQGIL